MGLPEVVIEFADAAALEAELHANLSGGGVFARGVGHLEPGQECQVVLVHPAVSARLSLTGYVVLVDEQGARIALVGFGPAARDELAEFVARRAAPPPAPPTPPTTDWDTDSTSDSDIAGLAAMQVVFRKPETRNQKPEASDQQPATSDQQPATSDQPPEPEVPLLDLLPPGELLELLPPGEVPVTESPTTESPTTTEPVAPAPSRPAVKNVHERLRGLTVAQQHRVAREGETSERVVLERLYGKTVWEALLRNPRLSVAEVTRISRMGALPRPLLELIVANPAWTAAPQIRRALLGNPRLPRDLGLKLLRSLPKHELKLVPKQTAYPQAIRTAARKLLKN